MYIGRHVAFDVMTSSFISKIKAEKPPLTSRGTHSALSSHKPVSLSRVLSELLSVLIPHRRRRRRRWTRLQDARNFSPPPPTIT